MTRSTYFDLGRSADARPGSESRYAQRFQCGNVVKRLIGTRMKKKGQYEIESFGNQYIKATNVRAQ
jgi:hypothetical protein